MKVFKLRLENSLPRMLWKTSKQGKLVRNWFPCNPVTRSVNITEDLLQKGHYPRPIAVVLQSFSCVWHFGTPRTAAHQASLSFTIFWSLHKLMLTESVMPSNHLILSRPFFLLPLIFPSIRVFSNELALCIRWPMYWNFSSALALPMNIQDWFHLGLTGLIPLLSKGLSRVFSSTKVRKQQFFSTQPSLWSNSHIHTWQLEKP